MAGWLTSSGWLVGWLVAFSWLSDWLTDWLPSADWLTAWLAVWLACCLQMTCWLAVWLVAFIWLADWLAVWLCDWLVALSWLADWLTDSLADWLAALLAGRLAGWLAVCLRLMTAWLVIISYLPNVVPWMINDLWPVYNLETWGQKKQLRVSRDKSCVLLLTILSNTVPQGWFNVETTSKTVGQH